MKSKFSIIVPCYNQSNFIYDCYVSVLAQNYYDWEIIFVNDGSTDNTMKVLNQIASFDKNVIVVNKENGGLSSARNAGIKASTGDYLIFLDCDDMLLPNCLSSIYRAIEKKSKLDIIQVGYRHIAENGMAVLTNVMPMVKEHMLPSILFNNLGPVHSFCISRRLVDKIGFFDEQLKSCEDWDYWIRSSFLADEVDAIHIVLVDYRMNEASMSRDSFTLYDSLKSVALRGKEIGLSKKIITENPEENFKNSLKNKLAMCLGVSVLQNKIEDSLALFETETQKYNLDFSPNDFKLMSSYLTFRYKTNELDVRKVLNDYKPLYDHFFKEIGFNKREVIQASWAVFSKHYHLSYKNKFGTLGVAYHKLKSNLI